MQKSSNGCLHVQTNYQIKRYSKMRYTMTKSKVTSIHKPENMTNAKKWQ